MSGRAAAPRIAWVDVFAERPFGGNPLAVVLDADAWPAEDMQALAAELHLSETAFALPATDPGADLRLRIFTPARELPMAGHPVVGAAWVLHAAGLIAESARIETGAGVLTVRARGDVATMEQVTPEAGAAVDAGEVARALGVSAADAPPARVWSTGVPQLMLPVADSAAVAAARPDAEALTALGRRDGWLGVSVYALAAGERAPLRAHVRHFAPGVGVPEDPVTGSAAGALGACLAAAGGGADGVTLLVVRQGAELGRGGEVAVRVECRDGRPERVQVGGRVVPLFEGRFVVGTLR